MHCDSLGANVGVGYSYSNRNLVARELDIIENGRTGRTSKHIL